MRQAHLLLIQLLHPAGKKQSDTHEQTLHAALLVCDQPPPTGEPATSPPPDPAPNMLLDSKRVAPQGVMCACAVAEGETKTKQAGGDNNWRRVAEKQAAMYNRQRRGHGLQHHGGPSHTTTVNHPPFLSEATSDTSLSEATSDTPSTKQLAHSNAV